LRLGNAILWWRSSEDMGRTNQPWRFNQRSFLASSLFVSHTYPFTWLFLFCTSTRCDSCFFACLGLTRLTQSFSSRSILLLA
jgi:hypothetical protein